ncbi:acyl-CoA dehydrogenase [Rathayibacter rathayi]|uniref:acyl-CoA dehydrogenase n=1 Tax=Rathayibacter rathayi TaxID=33887 RepID=UPI000CE74EE1|nr:acyl-CoA dehydrogenase [Rathayibacter rathayi]PPG90757.1 acyl-CoA dehydrogenase [Rathayibacter rathayi]PPG98804.1 acyl-CoA dehydrogenase [Rathayibacter rathayi]
MNEAFRAAADLDEWLGDPLDPASKISERDALAADRAAVFPVDAVESLNRWGVQYSYVPPAHGGRMDDVLTPMLQMRNVARRDVTVAVAHGKTFLGALPSWIAGADAARRMAELVRSGQAVSWGLTESGRGSDLLRSATTATPSGDQLVIRGGKWPVNNATRGRAMSALVRTTGEVSPRALTLVLVDKQDIDPRRVRYLPKVPTHGIRGADISGVDWDDARVPMAGTVGESGTGLETVLKALQITRPVCTALSLGAADQAQGAVLDFLIGRRQFGSSLHEFAGAQLEAGAVVADALTAEATSFVAARHVANRTEELALVSALAKFIVPTLTDQLFLRATTILGARSQLSGIAGAGRFEKANRDNRVVGIFDGNSVVNLHAIVNQFRALSRSPLAPADPLKLLQELDPAAPTASLDFSRLHLVTKNGAMLLHALPDLCDAAVVGSSPTLRRMLESFREVAAELMIQARTARPSTAPDTSQFETACGLAEVFAGCCCMVSFLSRSGPTVLASSEVWLTAAIGRICARLGRPADGTGAAQRDLGAAALAGRQAGGTPTLFTGWNAA